MSDEATQVPRVRRLTPEDIQAAMRRILDETPYETAGQLRDAVFDGDLCCACCFDWNHPHATAWDELSWWLQGLGEDWRTVE